ncbi:MAG: hypothetical protein KGJ72_15845 [Gammaproteobacteria bacterium]|nr:hypothetical protein [Gammaproteobacteria bacterium]
MREDNSDKVTLWMGITAALSLLLCCGLPLLVATLGAAALVGGAKWGLAGLGVVGLLAVGAYILRVAFRRRHGITDTASTAFHCCDCEPTVEIPRVRDPDTSTQPRSGP